MSAKTIAFVAGIAISGATAAALFKTRGTHQLKKDLRALQRRGKGMVTAVRSLT